MFGNRKNGQGRGNGFGRGFGMGAGRGFGSGAGRGMNRGFRCINYLQNTPILNQPEIGNNELETLKKQASFLQEALLNVQNKINALEITK